MRQHGKYMVYRLGGEWASARAAQGRVWGGYTHFAVRVLRVMQNGDALGVDGVGQLHTVPAHAFGPRIPECDMLPGAHVRVDGVQYQVEAAEDGGRLDGQVQTYTLRRPHKGGKSVVLRKVGGQWKFGAAARKAVVRHW